MVRQPYVRNNRNNSIYVLSRDIAHFTKQYMIHQNIYNNNNMFSMLQLFIHSNPFVSFQLSPSWKLRSLYLHSNLNAYVIMNNTTELCF